MAAITQSGSDLGFPKTLPLTTEQFEKLVELATFEKMNGQIELINGRIVRMNPQGPEHSDPIDFLTEWCVLNAVGQFTIRVEKSIRIPLENSCPEPDLAWVTRRRYVDQHPNPKMSICSSKSALPVLNSIRRKSSYSTPLPESWNSGKSTSQLEASPYIEILKTEDTNRS